MNVPNSNNQLWEFVTSDAYPGFFQVQSMLDASCLTALGPNYAVTTDQSEVLTNQHQWLAIVDPFGSGYCYLQSRVDKFVLEIENGSAQEGTQLFIRNPRSTGAAHQLWKAPFPLQEKISKELTWTKTTGTGTAGGGAYECAYNANLSLKSDGSWSFSGEYTNRGDTPLSTAPSQDFAVAFVVTDLAGDWFSFVWAAFATSAPTEGCTIVWDFQGTSGLISANWVSLALNNTIGFNCTNTIADDNPDEGVNQNLLTEQMQYAVSGAGGGAITYPSPDQFMSVPNSIFAMHGSAPGLVAGHPPIGVAGQGGPGKWRP